MTKLDHQLLDKELDRVKTKVFLGKNAAFLGSLMCNMNFSWVEDIETASTNGVTIYWNPHWFLKLPPDTRMTVLLHELWHVAFLHMVRRGDREPDIWNYAADIAINNLLYHQGYTFDGTHPWLDDSINRWKHPSAGYIGDFGEKNAEEIYDILLGMPAFSMDGQFLWGESSIDEDGNLVGDLTDLLEPEGEMGEGIDEHTIINKVVQASTSSKMAGMGADGAEGDVETLLKRFLQPKLPWETLLFQFFNEIASEDFTWSRPDRRYESVYLPSLQDEDGGLDHLIYYLDVSGSVSDGEVIRFNSEVKYIKDHFNPKRLTLVLFDTIIQREYEFYEEDPFEEVVIVGRGGTDLTPVREHMLLHRPNAVVVFSDLQCPPIEPLPEGIAIRTIWVGVNASSHTEVPFGTLVHIKE